MKAFLAGIFWLAAAACGSGISANAAVIASCGPMEGYSYFFGNELADNEPGWKTGIIEDHYDIPRNGQGRRGDPEERAGRGRLDEKRQRLRCSRGRGHPTRLHSPYPDPVGTGHGALCARHGEEDSLSRVP